MATWGASLTVPSSEAMSAPTFSLAPLDWQRSRSEEIVASVPSCAASRSAFTAFVSLSTAEAGYTTVTSSPLAGLPVIEPVMVAIFVVSSMADTFITSTTSLCIRATCSSTVQAVSSFWSVAFSVTERVEAPVLMVALKGMPLPLASGCEGAVSSLVQAASARTSAAMLIILYVFIPLSDLGFL